MWLDPDACNAARQAFHDHSDLFIAAFVVATLRNATTLIAKSFCATGIVTSARALTRIRHNTHHFFEIMMPGSLDHRADGWKLCLRIRLVHAQVRHLILAAGHWDQATYGTPLSAASMALSSANFSETTLSTATRLGARLTPAAPPRLHADLALCLYPDRNTARHCCSRAMRPAHAHSSKSRICANPPPPSTRATWQTP